MLRHPMTYAIASSGFITLARLLDYLGGRAGHPLAIALFPAGLLPLLGAAFFGVAALVFAARALICGRRILAPLFSVVVLVAFWRLPPLLLPTDPYLLGFAHRVFSAVTADQLRLVATKTTALTGTDDETHAVEWSEVSPFPGATDLHPGYVTSRNGIVEIVWGGALMGHWGLRIHSPAVARHPYDRVYWLKEPDIALFMTLD